MARWLVRAILCLALGVFTTLAFAWAAPVLASSLVRPPTWSNTRFWADDTHAGHYQVSHNTFADTVRFHHIIFQGRVTDKPYYKANPPPPWALTLTHAMHGDGPAANTPWWGVYTFASGWPLRAFRGGEYEPWPTTQPASPRFNFIPDGKGGLSLAPGATGPQPLIVGLYRFGGPAKDRYALPLTPIPRGLILNTLCFSAAWGLLGLTLGRVRRWRRRRSGRCPVCNYDLRGLAPGSTCPECGVVPAFPRTQVPSIPE